MTGSSEFDLIVGIAGALLVIWLTLVIALLLIWPGVASPREALRLMPDVLRLLRRLATDKTLPRGIRVRLVLLLAYLTSPIDLIPDFIPVLGYADDVLIVAAVLRNVARRAGLEALRTHWPGSDDGFAALVRITGLHAQDR